MELTFCVWKSDGVEKQYHLACVTDGQIRTSCGMVILASSKQPDRSTTERPNLPCCSVCVTRASKFSKKHFEGRPLVSGAKKTKTQKIGRRPLVSGAKKTKTQKIGQVGDEMFGMFQGADGSTPPKPGMLF